VLTEEKVDEIIASLGNLIDSLHRKQGFRVFSFKFGLLSFQNEMSEC
jgi:hypothetical protein